MGWLDRLSNVVRANMTHLVNQAEDPEKVLEQTVAAMQSDLIELRQAVAQAIATQKRTERQASQSQATAEEWHRRAQLALNQGDEDLARNALRRRQSYQETAQALREQIAKQQSVAHLLKENMRSLEFKIAEARTKKDMYIARARSARASERLHEVLGRVGNQSAVAAFEKLEEQILQMEARSEALAELNESSQDLERRFKALENGDVESELAKLKAQINSPPSRLQPGERAQNPADDPALERLRNQLEKS
jgi:phage shock protein A